MKNIKRVLRFNIHVRVDSSSSMWSWDKLDHRAIGYVPRHRLNESRFQRNAFFRACGGKNWSAWGMNGKTSVPPSPI